MASKNSVKPYLENSFYHIYNRGVEKRNIFMDNQDYSVFLSYLETYLTPKDKNQLVTTLSSPTATPKDKDKALKLLHLNNFFGLLDLVCYALLPNHFHLLIYQTDNVINHFMNSLGTRYSMYFNRKYKRSGVLFQDVYKAVPVESEEQLLHLSRYIHLNPVRWKNSSLPSSLPDYLGHRHTPWIKPHHVLDYFSTNNPSLSYSNFIGTNIDPDFVVHIAIDYDID